MAQARDASALLEPGFKPAESLVPDHHGGELAPLSARSRKEGQGSASRPQSTDEIERKHEEEYDNTYPAHIASHEGDLTALERVLEEYESFPAYDDSGRTPLFYATCANHLECCAMLLSARPDLTNLGDSEGDRPLHGAAYYGHVEVLDILLKHNADVNIRNKKGFAPMHVVSSVQCCISLMNHGADLFAYDENGRVPLFSACATDKCRIVTEILNSPRHDASKMLLIQDSFGDSALHAAACNGSLDCIKAFKGFIDLDLIRMTNNQGFTAEDLARMNHQHECGTYINELMATLFKKRQEDQNVSRRFTMFPQQEASVWANQVDSMQFDQSSYFGAGPGGGMNRPQTAAYTGGGGGGGGFLGGNHGSFAFGNQPAIPFFNGAADHRPQTAQSLQYGGLEHYEDPDSWGVFSRPYEDPQQLQDGVELDEEGRPKTPWTLRREQARMEDWYGEWAQFTDKESGQPFWWNAISGECQWETPERVKLSMEEAAVGDLYQDATAGYVECGVYAVSEAEQIRQRAFVLDRIGDWSECQDPVTGDIFFYNNSTGECEWELPPESEELREKAKLEELERQRQLAEEEAAALMWTMKRSQAESWKQITDEASGAVYYLNEATGETRWSANGDDTAEITSAAATATATAALAEINASDLVEEDIKSPKPGEDDLEALKDKLKAEAAAQIAEQVKTIITSTEEERERMRKEFEEKMKETAEQTKRLAERLDNDSEEAKRRKEAEILKLKNKEEQQDAKEKLGEEKAEIMAEHGEEIKQLANVLSADRMRQNEKLQEKLQERRRARALKRAQMLNQAKELKSPMAKKGPGSPMGLVLSPKGLPMSPKMMIMSPANGKPQVAGISGASGARTPAAGAGAAGPVVAIAPITSLLDEETQGIVQQMLSRQGQLQQFVSAHMQFFPSKLAASMLTSAPDNNKKEAETIIPLLWAVFRQFAIVDRKVALPRKLSADGLGKLLGQGNLKLLMHDREVFVKEALDACDSLQFDGFCNILMKLINRLQCGEATFFKETMVPVSATAALKLDEDSKRYQKESKQLATSQVRKLLQVNVAQLKIVYIYYSLVAEKRKSPCPKKTITVEELIIFAKDFALCPKMCSPKDLLQVFNEMHIRKPGETSSLQDYGLPFNQWVQLIFHASLRITKVDLPDGAKQEEHAHLHIVALLEHLDKSGGKNRIKAKGLKPFITVLGQQT